MKTPGQKKTVNGRNIFIPDDNQYLVFTILKDLWENLFPALILNKNKYKLTNEEILQDIKRLADLVDADRILFNYYKKFGKFSATVIREHFGTWENALNILELRSCKTQTEVEQKNFLKTNTILLRKICLDEIERVWETLGRQPVAADFNIGIFLISKDTFKLYFGSWRKAIETFKKYRQSLRNILQNI